MYTDQEETREVQEKKKCILQQFTDDGRKGEITVHLVLQARAKMSDNKVHGPEDAVASQMIKQLPLEKIYTVTKCFQERFMGQTEAPSSWKIVKLVFLRKPDADRAIALTSVMSKWYASGIILRLEKERELGRNYTWEELTGKRDPAPARHGSVVRPTMYLASLDIKTASDEARPRTHTDG